MESVVCVESEKESSDGGVGNDDNIVLSMSVDEMVEVTMVDVRTLVGSSDLNDAGEDDAGEDSIVASGKRIEEEKLDDSDDGSPSAVFPNGVPSVGVGGSIVVLSLEKVDRSVVVSVSEELLLVVASEVLSTEGIEEDATLFVAVNESDE